MSVSRAPEKGEVLTLGPPASGEVIIAVDPRSAGTTFAAGTQTLLPGSEMPVHKQLDREKVLFVHKGQGRATLNKRVVVVVPGVMLYVPRGTWHSVRNTGTGVLQIAWVSSPPGLEDFFRDLSRAGASPSAQAFQELAQRHKIELRQAIDAPTPVGRRHRGRRGGRRHHGGRESARAATPGPDVIASPTSAQPFSPAVASSGVGPTPSITPAAPATSGAPRGHRRRRRGGAGQRSTPPAVAQARREEGAGVSSSLTPASTAESARPGADRQRSSRRHRPRHVREVYMGGRWIRVEGEGPVIAPGRMGSEHRRPKRGENDEPPNTPLSVSL